MSNPSRDGALLKQLPTPYRVDSVEFDDPATQLKATAYPTADFLQAFEAILLTGVDDAKDPGGPAVAGLEQTIDTLATYFIAGERRQAGQPQTPEEFLPWLASWLAFSMRADLPRTARRDFIHNLTTLYQWRGTRENLKRVLEYFTGLPSTDSTVTVADADPHCFHVQVDLSALIAAQTFGDVPRLVEIAHALIRREKPAHTRYVLAPTFPSFRIGELNRDGTIKTEFFARVHGVEPDPRDGTKTIEIGNTLLGIDMWDA